jgi:hypothetical protein
MQPANSRTFAFAALIAFAVACSSSTSPADRALDGPWTTGLACLTLGLDLNWTSSHVTGDGNYRTGAGPTSCPALAGLHDLGTVSLTATRLSPTVVSGTMTFDGATRTTFTGNLIENSGSGRIDALVTLSDGTAVQVGLIEGLIP